MSKPSNNTSSFPRRRESSANKDWTPACAEVTKDGGEGAALSNLPVPVTVQDLPPPPLKREGRQLHECFSPDRRATFCAELALSGNVRAACRRIGVSPHTAYKARHRHVDFARAWDAALVLARDHAEAVLAERALEGVEEEVYYHGELVATRRRFDSRLLLAHLARLDKRCGDGTVAEDFDDLLARVIEGGAKSPPAHDLSREQFIAQRVAEAEREASAYWLYGEGEWDEVGPDPVCVAIEQAREGAGAEWDARRAALHARVDALAGEEGFSD